MKKWFIYFMPYQDGQYFDDIPVAGEGTIHALVVNGRRAMSHILADSKYNSAALWNETYLWLGRIQLLEGE